MDVRIYEDGSYLTVTTVPSTVYVGSKGAKSHSSSNHKGLLQELILMASQNNINITNEVN